MDIFARDATPDTIESFDDYKKIEAKNKIELELRNGLKGLNTGNFGDIFSPEKEGAERADFDFLIFFMQVPIKKIVIGFKMTEIVVILF